MGNVLCTSGCRNPCSEILARPALGFRAQSGELRSGKDASSRRLSLAALVVGIAAVVLQGIEYANLGFGPSDGGFASVFVGWTGLFAVTVFGAMVWLEIIVASAFRNGSRAPGSSRADLDALGFYLTFLAGLGVLSFGFLYLI